MVHHPVLSAFLRIVYISSLGITAVGVMLLRLDSTELPKFGAVVEAIALFFKHYSWIVAVLPGVAWVANYFSEKLETNWLL